MAQIVIRNLDDDVKAKLQERARRHGCSTEEEVREILRNAVIEEGAPAPPLGRRIKAHWAQVGLDEDIPELRGEQARPTENQMVQPEQLKLDELLATCTPENTRLTWLDEGSVGNEI